MGIPPGEKISGQNPSYPLSSGKNLTQVRPQLNTKVDGVAKSPPYGVTAFFQDLDIPDVCLRP